jgi:hypothetical protein
MLVIARAEDIPANAVGVVGADFVYHDTIHFSGVTEPFQFRVTGLFLGRRVGQVRALLCVNETCEDPADTEGTEVQRTWTFTINPSNPTLSFRVNVYVNTNPDLLFGVSTEGGWSIRLIGINIPISVTCTADYALGWFQGACVL